MQPALARHDLIAREAVSDHRGMLVKTTGDGPHAAFEDPLHAIAAVVQPRLRLADVEAAYSDIAKNMPMPCKINEFRRSYRGNFGLKEAAIRRARISGGHRPTTSHCASSPKAAAHRPSQATSGNRVVDLGEA
jgi:hypothetical protein